MKAVMAAEKVEPFFCNPTLKGSRCVPGPLICVGFVSVS